MSILLEALRKSEKDQRKFEAPNIYSGEQTKPVSHLLKGLLVLFMIVVVSAGAWFAWYQYQRSVETYRPPVTLTPDNIRATEKSSVPDTRLTTPETGNTKSPPSAMANSVASSRQRTPVESYQQASQGGSKVQAKGNAEEIKAVTQAGGGGKKKPTANKTSAGKAVSNKPKTTMPTESKPEKPRPHIPAPISYWELPDAIRAKVPEMRFSVLVFAKNPTNRFVLIDGQRFGQGDHVQPELLVYRIRREGVVFKYRRYKFLVEK